VVGPVGARTLIRAGSRFEEVFGYSRAVRVGPWICVSGCTAAAPGGPLGGADCAAQARVALERVAVALAEAGASLRDVVRTRFFVTDITSWEAIGEIHAELFAEVWPTTTIVEVSALVDPALLVEVEADAIVTMDR
jgi:enamine deaminase RidA (YjgF/YER057c/UK114 family)